MTVLNGAHLGDHVVLIIGAGAPKSLGFATAEARAMAGATVALADLPNSSVPDSLRRLAPNAGHSAHHVDVSQPEDQAATCVFLASRAARHITGQAVCVDGGQTLF
jgi:NAD(P)-dependent dehydrogenase (short-subunit alcohol dehydrogenase family)